MQPNRKIGEKPDEMDMPLGKEGSRQTRKESRGGKTSSTQEKGKATADMRGPREEGYEKIREDAKNDTTHLSTSDLSFAMHNPITTVQMNKLSLYLLLITCLYFLTKSYILTTARTKVHTTPCHHVTTQTKVRFNKLCYGNSRPNKINLQQLSVDKCCVNLKLHI